MRDTIRSNRAEKRKRRQTKTKRRIKKRRRKATIERTRGDSTGGKKIKKRVPRARRPRGGVLEIGRPKGGAPGVRRSREEAFEVGGSVFWSLSASSLSLVCWSICWQVFALAMQVFALATYF